MEVKVSQEVVSGPGLEYDRFYPRENEQIERETMCNQVSLISVLRRQSDYLLNSVNKLALQSSTI